MLKRETNHAWFQNFTWGGLKENGHYKMWKLIIHGYKNVLGDLNENDHY